MAELHQALASLAPTDWDDVPTDNLDTYLKDIFTAGELICNSVPPPPNGTPFHDAKPHFSQPNAATSAKEILASSARQFPAHDDHEGLQKHWGKAMKFSAKENPLNIAVYKMAGKDRHGAWFSRRSVHEGMGFAKFRKAMLREFPESLAVQGGPGEGSIRGIGGDRRLERVDVEGVGRLEVYQLSAQFPGPTTPREFITLLLTTDHGMTEKSTVELQGGAKYTPRSYMIVSKPISHPEAPARSGYIRGHYESVELIREIPLTPSKSKSTSDLLSESPGDRTGRGRGATLSFAESRGPDAKGEQRDLHHGEAEHTDPELNPVEWIMITRSEPGGGIPRFMVDRGTPSAMIGDISKWLDWACKIDETQEVEDVQPALHAQPDSPTDATSTASASAVNGHTKQDSGFAAAQADSLKRTMTEPTPAPQQQQQQQSGVLSHLTQALEAGIGSYAPAAVSSYLHSGESAPAPASAADEDGSSSSSSSSSSDSDSFMSASEMLRYSTAPDSAPVNDSNEAISLASTPSMDSPRAKSLSHHEKEVLKLAKQREKLDRKLAQKRESEAEKLRRAREQEDGEKGKARERYERELKKHEEKHRKELQKLEAKKAKETHKAAQKRRKRERDDQIGKVSRERDEFRAQADLLRREVDILHEQLGDLQRENTAMASRLGKLAGPEVLKSIRDEMVGGRRSRTSSMESQRRKGSGEKKGVAV